MTDHRDHFEPHPNIPFENDTPDKGMIGPLFALVVVAVLFFAAFFLSTGADDIDTGTSPTVSEPAMR